MLPGGDGHPSAIFVLLQVRFDGAFCDEGLIPCHGANDASVSAGDGNAGGRAADVRERVGLQERGTQCEEQHGAQDSRGESLDFRLHEISSVSVFGLLYPILKTEDFIDRKSCFILCCGQNFFIINRMLSAKQITWSSHQSLAFAPDICYNGCNSVYTMGNFTYKLVPDYPHINKKINRQEVTECILVANK